MDLNITISIDIAKTAASALFMAMNDPEFVAAIDLPKEALEQDLTELNNAIAMGMREEVVCPNCNRTYKYSYKDMENFRVIGECHNCYADLGEWCNTCQRHYSGEHYCEMKDIIALGNDKDEVCSECEFHGKKFCDTHGIWDGSGGLNPCPNCGGVIVMEKRVTTDHDPVTGASDGYEVYNCISCDYTVTEL